MGAGCKKIKIIAMIKSIQADEKPSCMDSTFLATNYSNNLQYQ